jgi:hypothetical protein
MQIHVRNIPRLSVATCQGSENRVLDLFRLTKFPNELRNESILQGQLTLMQL